MLMTKNINLEKKRKKSTIEKDFVSENSLTHVWSS